MMSIFSDTKDLERMVRIHMNEARGRALDAARAAIQEIESRVNYDEAQVSLLEAVSALGEVSAAKSLLHQLSESR